MAVTSSLLGRVARLGAGAPAPVHVAVGHGGGQVVAHLRADDRVDVVATPRHATVLVVAGHVPDTAVAALRATHDQVPGPRATVVVDAHGADVGLASATSVPSGALLDHVVAAHQDVLAGRLNDPTVGPAVNPVEWRGVGPHGQGGEGMMGGVPWGRPMAMPPVAGRDGLALDRLDLRLGPFLTGLPPLMVVRVGLQGDVLEEVTIEPIPPDDGATIRSPADDMGATGILVDELVALAEVLAMAGLAGLATRAARLAANSPTTADLDGLRHRLDRRFGLRLATDGVGRLELPEVSGDITDRFRRWLDRATAAVSGDAVKRAGPLDLQVLAAQLVGMEVGAALLTLASLRPEIAAATAAAGVGA